MVKSERVVGFKGVQASDIFRFVDSNLEKCVAKKQIPL